LDPSIPYAWQPQGETIEISTAKGQRLNVLGFFNTDNDLTPFCVEGSVTTDTVIGCFDLFCQTITRKTMVIMGAGLVLRKLLLRRGLTISMV